MHRSRRTEQRRVWVAVKVERGIPVMAEVYTSLDAALAREAAWRQDMSPEDDETGVFETVTRRRATLTTLAPAHL